MLTSMEEVDKATQVINGVDNPNVMSVSSVAPIPTTVDETNPAHKSSDSVSNPSPELKEEPKKEEKEPEVKKEEEKKEDNKEPEKEEKKEEVPPKETSKEADTEHKPDYKDALQKRFDDLTKKRRTAERERDYERDLRLKTEEELKKLKSTIPSKDKPKVEDFDSQEEYDEALATWAAEKKLNEYKAEVAKADEEKKVKEEIYTSNEVLDEAISTGRDKYEDFDKVVLEPKDLPFTQALVDIILDSEISDEVMYYLAKNPDDLVDISKLNARRAAREITLIETKLLSVAKKKEPVKKEETPVQQSPKLSDASEGGLVQKEEPPKKKITNAPDPITPLRTTGMAEKDPNDMSPKEYRAWRERDKR